MTITDGPEQDDDDYVRVSLVGGPRAWAGLALEGVYTRWEIFRVPLAELGADLCEPGDPRPRPPVARYRPLGPDSRAVWHFVGWDSGEGAPAPGEDPRLEEAHAPHRPSDLAECLVLGSAARDEVRPG